MRTSDYAFLLEYSEMSVMIKIWSEAIHKIIMLKLSSVMKICKGPKYQNILWL